MRDCRRTRTSGWGPRTARNWVLLYPVSGLERQLLLVLFPQKKQMKNALVQKP